MRKIRLFFPLIISRQLITGVNSVYRQEINKLRSFGFKYITPYIKDLKFRNYPYKISFIYYSSDKTDIISILTITSYILHLLENSIAIQSTDYRVLPQLDVHTEVRKISLFEKEGCEIIVEPLQKNT